jgi:ATP-dependent DNA helicase RecQ
MSDRATPTQRPLEVLAARFGFDAFRPGQEQVVEALLAGRSALAVFPTGAGKSLCYQLPALLLDGMTIVVSPLIALMKDQIDFLQRSGIDAARLDSSLDAADQREIFDRLRAGSLKLLYVAPERFSNERFLSQLARTRISLFAVDEAHCISEWGHNFRPDYLKLAERTPELAAERVLALTATATPAVVADIRAGFAIAEADAVVTGFYRPNLTLLTTPVAAGERKARLVERLRERPSGSTIVYVTLQRTALRIAEHLASAGLLARPYHAGMDAEERAAVQEWWTSSEEAIVVATIAFGMGIDKADVRYVYHYNLSKSLESYSQEIGRAGRDGKPSMCELFACPDDVPTLENFAYGDTPTREALTGLLAEVLDHPVGFEFAVSEYELSGRHDLRPLVLKTVLTYIELDGVLRQGTPFYAGYRLRPLGDMTLEEVYGRFDESRADFLRRLIATGKTGRTWTTLSPDDAATELGEERSRILAALEYLDEQGLVELQPSEVRQLHDPRPPRLHRRDRRELARTLRAPGARRDGTDRERTRTRHPRRLPGVVPRRLLRRDAHGAVWALQPLPDRTPPTTPRARTEAADRDERQRRRPPSLARSRAGRARHPQATGAIPRRHYKPSYNARKTHQGPALRLPRRTAVFRRSGLVRGDVRINDRSCTSAPVPRRSSRRRSVFGSTPVHGLLHERTPGHRATYAELVEDCGSGWTLPEFMADELVACREGYLYEENDNATFNVFNRRSGAIAAAIYALASA